MILILLLILIFLFPFGVLTQIPLQTNFPVRIYLQDIVLIILIIVFVYETAKGKIKLSLSKQSRFFMTFVFFAALSLTLNLARLNLIQILIGSLYLIRLIAYFFVYLSAFHQIRKQDQNKRIIFLLFLAGFSTCVLGIIQYSLYPNLRNLLYLGFDPHENRIFGTFLDPNFFGIISVLTAVVTNYHLQKIKQNKKKHFIFALLIVIFSLLFSYSRSSFLAFFTAVISLYMLNRNLKLVLINILAFFFFLVLIPKNNSGEGVRLERTSTVHARVVNYKKSFEIFKKSPLFGVGFNTLRFAKEKFSPNQSNRFYDNAAAGSDSSFLLILATTGLFGFLIFSKFLFASLVNKEKYSSLIVPSTLSVLVHSLFINSLFFPWVLFWLFLIWGISDGSKNRL